MTPIQRYRISRLPLAPSALLPTHNLTPDPLTPSVSTFRSQVLKETPSVQRRARLLSPEAHFSYVTPFVVSGGFPFRIDFENVEEADQAAHVEKWLSERESVPQDDKRITYPKHRDPAMLLGISETGLRDCLPHLDVGDAFSGEVLGTPALVPSQEPASVDTSSNPATDERALARQELIDVLSGRAVLMSEAEEGKGIAPWAMRYSGHQFGNWAGQLGDGRAISIYTTPHPEKSGLTYELQLKGAGRTPFSRSADGLAVVRSSIREYLCAEAMHALGIPTTRSLSLVNLPDIPVRRERLENASILTRLAPSFIRIGSFEALSPPDMGKMFFFGGGQQESHWEGLRILGEWVEKVLWPDKASQKGSQAWGKDLVLEVARRNAEMVAGWQAYGFMHGVINTDNVSILGLTIDYGPYAFMDVFDPMHICNHSDDSGRYAYMYQPNMVLYAVRALLNSLAPLIGAEAKAAEASGSGHGFARVNEGWASSFSQEEMKELRLKGKELVADELERVFQETTSLHYAKFMRRRLGLRREVSVDESTIFRPLLDLMHEHRLDFHITFRNLCAFSPSMLHDSEELDKYLEALVSACAEPRMVDLRKAKEDWRSWLSKYGERITQETSEWETAGADINSLRSAAMRGANPRFVLRQWVLEEVIEEVETNPKTGRRILAKVMHMACNPFEPWGGEGEAEGELDAEITEEARFCGVGEQRMLGFQCSCSS